MYRIEYLNYNNHAATLDVWVCGSGDLKITGFEYQNGERKDILKFKIRGTTSQHKPVLIFHIHGERKIPLSAQLIPRNRNYSRTDPSRRIRLEFQLENLDPIISEEIRCVSHRPRRLRRDEAVIPIQPNIPLHNILPSQEDEDEASTNQPPREPNIALHNILPSQEDEDEASTNQTTRDLIRTPIFDHDSFDHDFFDHDSFDLDSFDPDTLFQIEMDGDVVI